MPSDSLTRFRSIERRIESALVDLRQLRTDLAHESASKGILGSRGLTQFVVDLLKSGAKPAWSITELLSAAELAGYSVPTSRTLSKRLTDWQYRKGGVRWRSDVNGWTWKQDSEAQ